MWVYRKSKTPSPTDVKSYWVKPLMKNIGTSKKFIEISELCGKRKQDDSFLPSQVDTSAFFNKIVKKANEVQIDCQISRHLFDLREREVYSLSIHQLLLNFLKSENKTAQEFIRYSISKMTPELCSAIELITKNQKDNLLWHELRYARITASNVHEATRCKTPEGSLTLRLLGASKKFDSVEMERGRELEKKVLLEAEKKINKKLVSCGLILIPQYPVMGASPDARGDDFVVEVKCPSKEKTVQNYILNGKITAKYHAQIQLQMFASGTKKGLFCVADPKFEENKKVNLLWVDYNEKYMVAVLKNASNFWKNYIFDKLIKSFSS